MVSVEAKQHKDYALYVAGQAVQTGNGWRLNINIAKSCMHVSPWQMPARWNRQFSLQQMLKPRWPH